MDNPAASLADLRAERDRLQSELARVKARIAAHPKAVNEHLPALPAGHPLLKRVSRVEPFHGSLDYRKNVIPIEGFVFTLDGKDYAARHGSSWCSSVCDVVEGDPEQLTGGDRVRDEYAFGDAEGVDEALANGAPAHVLVAALLLAEYF